MYILEHMFVRKQTAFKHPGCGGVIFAYERRGRRRFKCEGCGLWATDLAELALGPLEESRHEGDADSPEKSSESGAGATDTQ